MTDTRLARLLQMDDDTAIYFEGEPSPLVKTTAEQYGWNVETQNGVTRIAKEGSSAWPIG